MNLLFLIGITGCVVLALIAVIASRRSDSDAADLSWTETLLGLSAAFSVRTTALLILMRNGMELMTMDEPIRWRLGWGWSNRPYFFTSWDGVWLPGQLALSGTLDKLIHTSLIALQVGVLFCQALTLAGVFYLAYVLSRRRSIGTLAALIAATGYPLLWMGTGPLVETIVGGIFLLAVAFLIRFAQLRAEGRRGLHFLLAGALFTTLTTAFHFIGWAAVFVGMCFLIPLALLHRREVGRPFWPALGLIAFSAAIVPAVWILDSWHYLGHPFQFLANLHDAMRIGDSFGPQGYSIRFRSMLYPNELLQQVGMLVPLIVCGLFIGGPGARTRRVLFGLIALLALIMETEAIRGNVPHIYFRSLIIVYLLLIVLACISLAPVVTTLRGGSGRRYRTLAWAGLTLMLLGWAGVNLHAANKYEERGEDIPHDMIALGKWLQQETRRPKEMPGFGPATRIGIFPQAFGHERMAYLGYAAGCPERLKVIPDADFKQGKFNLLDCVFVDGDMKPSPGWELFNQFGHWKLYRRTPRK